LKKLYLTLHNLKEGKHFLTSTYNKYGHAFWRLAKLIVREGRLPEADILFHVTFPELETLINERNPTIVVRARLRNRFHSIKDNLKFNETSIGPIIKPRDLNKDRFNANYFNE
jgi:pyruvate,water dikinase